MDKTNYTMMCDFYELTMANGYLEAGAGETIAYFDVFFRTIPDQGGFAIACGLEEIVRYIENLLYRRGYRIFTFEKYISRKISRLLEKL